MTKGEPGSTRRPPGALPAVEGRAAPGPATGPISSGEAVGAPAPPVRAEAGANSRRRPRRRRTAGASPVSRGAAEFRTIPVARPAEPRPRAIGSPS